MRRSTKPDPSLAAAIRQMREERGFTREGLAHDAGVAVGTLALPELAKSVPAWCTVLQIAEAMDVPFVELAKAHEDLSLATV